MIPLLIQLVLFAITVTLLAAALILAGSSTRAGTYQAFEERAAVANRLALAAYILVIVEFLIGIPLLGAVLAIAAILWTIWWIPRSRRQFEVSVTSTFDARPEAVAAVMFDVSQQPRWLDSIVAASLETPGLLRKGSVVRQIVRISGDDVVARLVVTDLAPYERLVFEASLNDGRRLRDEMEIQPQAGGSLVRYAGQHEMSLTNAVLTGWRLPAMRKRFTERRLANLERLRALVHPAPLARRA